MGKRTAAEIRAKHAKNLKAATEEIARGVQRVNEAPGKRAAAKVDKMRNNLLEKIDDGTWAERVSAVPLEDWKKAMIEKGISRIGSGIDAAAAKTEDFFQQLIDYQDGYADEIANMPDDTREARKQRMLKNYEKMSGFRKR